MGIVIFSGTDPSLAAVANYSTAALPVNGDTLIIRQRETSITASLSALAGIALAALIVEASFTGDIGSGNTHAEIDADVVVWAGQGSKALIDFAAHAITSITVNSTGAGAADGLESVRIKGSDIGDVYVLGGSLCIAGNLPTDTADVDSLTVGSTAAGSLPYARIGTGTTIADITIYAGTLINAGASPTGAVLLDHDQANYYPQYSASHPGTVVINAGQLIDQTDGTITALTLSGGTYDASQDPRPKTLTDFTFNRGNLAHLNNLTFTNAPALVGKSITIS